MTADVRQRATPMATLQDRVLARIHALKEQLDYAQKGLADHLRVTQGTMSKILSGKQPLTLEYIEEFCFIFQVTPEELVAEPGSQMVVLRPMESDLLFRFRQMDDKDKDALIDVLDWRLKKTTLQPYQRGRKRTKTAALREDAIQVARQFQSAPDDARRIVSDVLSADALGKSSGSALRTPVASHRVSDSHEPVRKSRK